MPRNESAPKQSSETRSELTKTQRNMPTPALDKQLKPEADKPKHEPEENPEVRQRREDAAAVRSGTKADEFHPTREQVKDDRSPDEVAADELAEQRLQEQRDTARSNNAPEPEEGTAIDLERHPELARIDGEPVEQPKQGKK